MAVTTDGVYVNSSSTAKQLVPILAFSPLTSSAVRSQARLTGCGRSMR